jgi:RNase P subunit RPR2
MANQNFDPDWDGIFREIRDEMVAWRRAHPKATMRDIELENERLLARLHARMVADVAAASAAADFAGQPAASRPRCPECDVPLVARGKKKRSLRSHGNQPVAMERVHGTCPQCGQAFFPSG